MREKKIENVRVCVISFLSGMYVCMHNYIYIRFVYI